MRIRATVAIADDEHSIARCYPVMQELRTHLDLAAYSTAVNLQRTTQGFRLAYVEAEGAIRSVAGYRLLNNLAYGYFLYVDDLVTRRADQGAGYGVVLFEWLVDQARRHGCGEFHLDSGVQRFGAHRFYLGRRMDITPHHFALQLTD